MELAAQFLFDLVLGLCGVDHFALVFLSPEAKMSFYGEYVFCMCAHSDMVKLGPKRRVQDAHKVVLKLGLA